MTRQEIIEKIDHFLIDEMEIDGDMVTPASDMRQDMGIDSLDYVDIVAFVKRTFGFRIQTEDFNKMTTLGQFYDYIEAQI